MRKLLAALALLGLASFAEAALPIRYVQISTGTVTKQTGSFNVQAGTFTTVNTSSLTVTGAANIDTSLLVSSFSAVGPSDFNASLRISSNVIDGSGSIGTAGQVLQTNAGSAPTWVNIPAAILTTTSTWTAGQIFSSMTVSTANITVANISSTTIAGYFMPPVYSSMTVGIVISSITTSSATAVATGIWVPSHATLTITPKFTTSRIRLEWSSNMTNSNLSRDCYVSVFRGTTNLGNINGMNHQGNATETGPATLATSILYYDTPNTTSATTYTVYFKTSGSVTCTINSQATVNVFEATELR